MKPNLINRLLTVLSGGLVPIVTAGVAYSQTVNDQGTKVLSLSAMLQKQTDLTKYVVPVENAISLPLPTLRCHAAGFASFASAAVRAPGKPTEQDVPSRWWVLDAKSGELLLYAETEAVPFSEGKDWKPTVVQSRFGSIAEMQKAQREVQRLVDELAPLFFAQQSATAEKRTALLDALSRYISPELLPQYRALVPDFFKWLADGNVAQASASKQTQ
jgi:hypothetical protein